MRTLQILLLTVSIFWTTLSHAQYSLIIQEDTIPIGICTMDGVIDSTSQSVQGFTGLGVVDIDNGVGIGMSWSFRVDTTGTYSIFWRYAFGGGDLTMRDGRLLVDNVEIDTVEFLYTGPNWNNYALTDTYTVALDSGFHKIRLSSITHKGLPNLDYFQIMGPDSIHPTGCTPDYTFSLSKSIDTAGEVSYEPVQDYYDIGTEITVTVDTVYPGYFFHSWSGEASSEDSIYTFMITQNTHIMALFYPDTTPAMDPNAMGYATVQHNNGTPYLLIGGALGDTVYAHTVDDLKTYLGGTTPRVVIFYEQLTGNDEISIGSHKTLIGTDSAHLQGIKLGINNARNVIIKNMILFKVLAADEIEINSGMNIWIDHCDLYTDRDHDATEFEDYYDGLIDIKNEARFITISNCYLHHHRKTSLISSGDQEVLDTAIRVTYYKNFFDSCASRLPSIRFGKAHILNNYYKDCNTSINSRMGACVRVERNYFENVGTAVMIAYSEYGGSVELIDNHFGTSSYVTEPTCELNVPYEYDDFIIAVDQVPAVVSATAGIDTTIKFKIPQGYKEIPVPFAYKLFCFPNPVRNLVTISFQLPKKVTGSLILADIAGRVIKEMDQHEFHAGINRIEVNVSDLKEGMYIYQLRTKNGYGVNRLVIQR